MNVNKAKRIFCILVLAILFTTTTVNSFTFISADQIRTITTAEKYTLGSTLDAAIDENGDIDFYTFEITVLSNIEIYTLGSTDTFGVLIDESGYLVAIR